MSLAPNQGSFQTKTGEWCRLLGGQCTQPGLTVSKQLRSGGLAARIPDRELSPGRKPKGRREVLRERKSRGIVGANWPSATKITQGAARLPRPFPGNPPRTSQKHQLESRG